MKSKIVVILLSLFCCMSVWSQSAVSLSGQVIDAQSGEPLQRAQIVLEGSTQGTTTDAVGQFRIQLHNGATFLVIKMLGYKTERVPLSKIDYNKTFVCRLEPDVYMLEDVIVSANGKKYKRKGNPAVELLKNVIDNKKQNYLTLTSDCKYSAYEKMVVSVAPFDSAIESRSFWRELQNVEKYVDSTTFDARAALPFAMREIVSDEYQTADGKQHKLVKAERHEGLGYLFDQGGLEANLNFMLSPVDILQNDIDIMTVKFVSPLSETAANAYYHYYLLDTLSVDGIRCADLAFVPINSESYGFLGHLYISLDSAFAVKAYDIGVSDKINLNWLNKLRLKGNYEQTDNGQWVLKSVTTEANLAVMKKAKHYLNIRQTRRLADYEVGEKADENLFTPMQSRKIKSPDADNYSAADWEQLRLQPLTDNEEHFDSLTHDLLSISKFRAAVGAYTILAGDYLPTSRDIRQSRWDFFPLTSTATYNGVEGARLRIGGMTTANLNRHWFFHTYLAYGFKDNRPKGMARIVYSFNEKKYHSKESLRHSLTFEGSYDLETQGNVYGAVQRDHIFMAIDPLRWVDKNWNQKMQYVGKASVKYEKEWANMLSITAEAAYENVEASANVCGVNGLSFSRLDANGAVIAEDKNSNRYSDVALDLQLRYSPGSPIYNNRLNAQSSFNLSKNAPVFVVNHNIGYLIEDRMLFNRTELSVEYRWWLSAFGHIDMIGKGGIVWSKSPFTKLYVAPTNTSFFYNPKSFNLLRSMEFMNDRYLMWSLEYHADGLVLNRIPYINRLKMRGVASFKGLWGYLSNRNNPLISPEGLYALPAETSLLDKKMPYMEVGVGIENILKFIRIDYIRRLTYIEGLGAWQRNAIKVSFSVEF